MKFLLVSLALLSGCGSFSIEVAPTKSNTRTRGDSTSTDDSIGDDTGVTGSNDSDPPTCSTSGGAGTIRCDSFGVYGLNIEACQIILQSSGIAFCNVDSGPGVLPELQVTYPDCEPDHLPCSVTQYFGICCGVI